MRSSTQLRSKLEHPAAGLVLAVLSAASFGLSGTFARPLLDAGWTPGAAVALRTAAASLVLLPFAARSLRGRWRALLRAWPRLILFGIVGVCGAQFCYFAAVERLPVGIAILIEFLGPVVLVILTSIAHRAIPPRTTIIGALVSIAGLFLVLDLTGTSSLDPIGVAIALTAAFCIAGYFHLAGTPLPDVPPIALATAGLVVGAIILTLTGVIGILPFEATTANVDLLGSTQPWWVPMAVIVLVSTAFSYTTGIVSVGLLGARIASFVALLEVLFAVIAAWILLDEVPTVIQGLGGALILAGVALVRLEGTPDPADLGTGSGDGGEHLLGDEPDVVEIGEIEDLQVAPLGTC